MKKGLVYAALALWILGGIQFFTGYESKDEEKVLEAFQNSEFAEAETIIESYGMYKGEFLSINEREQLIAEVGDSLGLKDYQVISEYTEGKGVTTLEKNSERVSAKLQFFTIEDTIKEQVLEKRQYFLVELRLYQSVEHILNIRKLVEKAMEQYEINAEVTMNIKGSYEGRLTQEEKNREADRLLDTLAAEIVTEQRNEELFTIYAYSKFLKEYRGNTYDNINVNIAMSYDEAADRTYLYLAAPVISENY